MKKSKIDKLIINSPYEEPRRHWEYDRATRMFSLTEGRRKAGYIIASAESKSFDDPGIFVEIPLVNSIRPRVKKWREAGYPGITGITKRLLEHWYDPEQRQYRKFFFCQLEAIETLVWFAEAPEAEKTGIDIPSDGGEFMRLCSKMATGSGKTIVMAMLIAWQILNKTTYPQDKRFSKNIFIVAPGLTVRKRLEVLLPSGTDNYYREFNIVPGEFLEKIRLGKIIVRNWHALAWDTEEQIKKKRGVDKRGAKSDEAYVREVLGELAKASNILVINDEAHHAWRIPAESKIKNVKKEDIEEATKWVGGLDRIHRARRILSCYDFSATPFAPSGKKSSDEALFDWIISDFGLNDAIESGLVKTPRVVIRDDSAKTRDYKSRLYHIYKDPEVQDDLNRKAEETETLPDLVMHGYYLLGKDWLETANLWKERRLKVPPVMITVANRTETAARIRYSFDAGKIRIPELQAPERTLHIDSKVLAMAEEMEEIEEDIAAKSEETEDEEERPVKLTKKEKAQLLRQMVDTVGKQGQAGADIQNVISVGMLSEGWDAKTVTHIMGLRAFSSQLLCEQVVGRGLRRTSYETNPETGLFEAEYVNIFGVPFTFLPHEETEGTPPAPPKPTTMIEPDNAKTEYEIQWPNIIRIDHGYKPVLELDYEKVKKLELDAADAPTRADMAAILDGKPDITKLTEIDLEELAKRYRMQKVIFETARDVYDQMRPSWTGNKEYLLAQLIRLVEKFLYSGKIWIVPDLFNQDEIKKRLVFTLNMNKIVQHIWEAIRFENTETVEPIFDTTLPIRSTAYMQTWYTTKPCTYTQKSHINQCICDSGWEDTEAYELDKHSDVEAWVKNDHLGYEIPYIYKGVFKKYRPDFIIRLRNKKHLVLEVKGQDSQENRTKREFLGEWIRAVNDHGGFGVWAWGVSLNVKDVYEVVKREMEVI
jgi:type III restriction enzyme